MRLLYVALLSAVALCAQTQYMNTSLTLEGSANYCGVDTGSVNAYVCANATGSKFTAYHFGQAIIFKASHANTGAATLSVDGLSAVPLKKNYGSTVLSANDIVVGAMVSAVYDGTNFQIGNNSSAGGSLPSSWTLDGSGGLDITSSGNNVVGTLSSASGILQDRFINDTSQNWSIGVAGSTATNTVHSGFFLADNTTAKLPVVIYPTTDNMEIGATTYSGTSLPTDNGDVLQVAKSLGIYAAGAAPALKFGDGTAAEDVLIQPRIGIGNPFLAVYPATNGKQSVFQVFPHGTTQVADFSATTAVAWVDACSNDLNDPTLGSNYECVRIGKTNPGGTRGGVGVIETTAGGTGVVRDLSLNPNNGNVQIGKNLTTQGTVNYCGADTGSGNTYACAMPAGSALKAYQTGQSILVKLSHANTAASTLNVDGLGAIPIKMKGAPLADPTAGQLANGVMYWMEYDGSAFQANALANVTSFQGRTGAVTLLPGDLWEKEVQLGAKPMLANWLAQLHNSSNQLVQVLVMGDSTVACDIVTAAADCWVNRFRTYLGNAGYIIRGPGLIPLFVNTVNNTADGYKALYSWTLTGAGWVAQNGSDPVTYATATGYATPAGYAPTVGPVALSQVYKKYMEYIVNKTEGGTGGASNNFATLSSVPNVDTFCIYFALSTDTANGFQYQVDSGTITLVAGSNATAGSTTMHAPVCVSAGTLGTHSITLIPPATGYAHLFGVEPNQQATIGTNKGVVIHNLAYPGSDTAFMGQSTTAELAPFSPSIMGNIALVIDSYGGENDWQQSPEYNTATFQTYTQNIVTYFKGQTVPASILMLGEPIDQNSTNNPNGFGTLFDYRHAFAAVAGDSTQVLSFLDIADYFGNGWATGNALGLYGDHIHPNTVGHQTIAGMIEQWLVDTPQSPASSGLVTGSSGGFGLNCNASQATTAINFCLANIPPTSADSISITQGTVTTRLRLHAVSANGYFISNNLIDNSNVWSQDDATRGSVYLTLGTSTTAASNAFGVNFMAPGSTTPFGLFAVQESGRANLVNGIFASGNTANTDQNGELTLAAATTASYTFAITTAGFTVHHECVATPQADPGSGNRWWVTYTGTASFTVNFSSAYTGTVSYYCSGRN